MKDIRPGFGKVTSSREQDYGTIGAGSGDDKRPSI